MNARSAWVTRLRTDQSGLTLIELMVTSLLLGLVSAVVVGIMISLLTTQRTVSTVTADTVSAQLVADSIGTPVRNASSFQLTTVGSNDQLLIARVASSTATITWRCTAWYYSASEQTIFTTTQSGPIATPTSAGLASWVVLAEGVTPFGESAIFTEDGPIVEVAYQVATGDTSPVAIQFRAARLTGLEESTACF